MARKDERRDERDLERPRCAAFIAVSVDGFIARPDGGLDWLDAVRLEGEDYGYQAFFDSVDALVMGRNSYDAALSFEPWPYAGKRCIVLTIGRPASGTARSSSTASRPSWFERSHEMAFERCTSTVARRSDSSSRPA